MLFYFESNFPNASPVMKNDEWMVIKTPISLPYTTSWQNPDGQAGLIRVEDEFYNVTQQRYEHDTLYTILKTNINARERFFALADEIKQALDQKASRTNTRKNPFTRLVQLLNQWATVYLPFDTNNLCKSNGFTLQPCAQNSSFLFPLSSLHYPVSTPPPEV